MSVEDIDDAGCCLFVNPDRGEVKLPHTLNLDRCCVIADNHVQTPDGVYCIFRQEESHDHEACPETGLYPDCELIRCPYEKVYHEDATCADCIITYNGSLDNKVWIDMDTVTVGEVGERIKTIGYEFLLYEDGMLAVYNKEGYYPSSTLHNVSVACWDKYNLLTIIHSNELNVYLPSVSRCIDLTLYRHCKAVVGSWSEYEQGKGRVTLLLTIPLTIEVCHIVSFTGYLNHNLAALCVTVSSELVFVRLDGECEYVDTHHHGVIKEVRLLRPHAWDVTCVSGGGGAIAVLIIMVCDDVSLLLELNITYDTEPHSECKVLETGVLSASELEVVMYTRHRAPKACVE